MNRELKFRAWDTKNKKFIASEKCEASFTLAADGRGIAGVPYSWRGSEDPKYFIISQYTGLKDQKKKEIYEGDIVDKGRGEIFWDAKAAMFKVRWHHKTWKEVRGNNPTYNNGEPLFANHEIVWEVIGNIYQNPELLK